MKHVPDKSMKQQKVILTNLELDENERDKETPSCEGLVISTLKGGMIVREMCLSLAGEDAV